MLVVGALPAIRAAKQVIKTIPIVMVTTEDPVTTGLIESLARPGGNITGLTQLTRELSGKRLELLTEVTPTVEQPKKFEFIVNLKAANQIGVTIPPNILARADRVIK